MKKVRKIIIVLLVYTFLLQGCGEEPRSLDSINYYTAYEDAKKIIKQQYPDVTSFGGYSDKDTKIFETDAEHGYGVQMLVEENGKQQAVVLELVYSEDGLQYRVVTKCDVDDSPNPGNGSVTQQRETNVQNTPRLSKNEMYYLCVKTIAAAIDMDADELLWDESFPGVSECRFSQCSDGSIQVVLPAVQGNELMTLICKIYGDGSCELVSGDVTTLD